MIDLQTRVAKDEEKEDEARRCQFDLKQKVSRCTDNGHTMNSKGRFTLFVLASLCLTLVLWKNYFFVKLKDFLKLKAFADKNLDGAEMVEVVFDRIENIFEKGENFGNQHFLLLHNFFKGSLKMGLCGN